MNDFTKDDLEILNTALSVYEKRIFGNASPTRFSSLLKMIRGMIDNYCEHESLEFMGDVFGYDCKKCQKRFGYEDVGEERHQRIVHGDE